MPWPFLAFLGLGGAGTAAGGGAAATGLGATGAGVGAGGLAGAGGATAAGVGGASAAGPLAISAPAVTPAMTTVGPVVGGGVPVGSMTPTAVQMAEVAPMTKLGATATPMNIQAPSMASSGTKNWQNALTNMRNQIADVARTPGSNAVKFIEAGRGQPLRPQAFHGPQMRPRQLLGLQYFTQPIAAGGGGY